MVGAGHCEVAQMLARRDPELASALADRLVELAGKLDGGSGWAAAIAGRSAGREQITA